jgi:hypothetical protein
MSVEIVAYLDGGTTSMLLAALAAGGAGIAVLVKMYWNRFLGVFSADRRAAAEEARAKLTSE